MTGTRKYIAVIIFAAIILYAFVKLTATVKVNETEIEGFTPVKMDEMAAKYAPVVLPSEQYEAPVRLLYRASKDDKGNIHLAYHYIWKNEVNKNDGLMPFLSRNLYTGGLSLQKVMFGKGDVEVVGMVIAPGGRVVKVDYETAQNYDPGAFSVTHKDVTVDGPVTTPVCFRVISWNHMFDYVTSNDGSCNDGIRLDPEYFTKELWDEYSMFKREETMLKKNRAHFKWERESV